jgi:hypothetical protein
MPIWYARMHRLVGIEYNGTPHSRSSLMGRLFLYQLPQTIGTAVTVLAVPGSDKLWLLHSARLYAVVDATVATRKIRVNHVAVADRQALAPIMYSQSITAGTNGTLAIGKATIAQGAGLFATDGAVIMLSQPLVLQMNIANLEINLDNGVAGDIYNGYMLWEEVDIGK